MIVFIFKMLITLINLTLFLVSEVKLKISTKIMVFIKHFIVFIKIKMFKQFNLQFNG